MALRVLRLINDIYRDPLNRLGKPEPSKGDKSGYWSRRINDEHRLVLQSPEKTSSSPRPGTTTDALPAARPARSTYRKSAYGAERGGRIADPFGNIWWVIAPVEEVAADEMWRRLQEPVYAEVMRVAQETLDAELSGRGYGRSSAPITPAAG